MIKNADQPAYPVTANIDGRTGVTKKERLAMEIYAKIIQETPVDIDREIDIQVIEQIAQTALRAADIFFEVMEKNSKV